METEVLLPTPASISQAARLLKQGQLVAFPTETVYGLGARIFDEAAINRIYLAKGRPSDNPLIAHIASLSEVDRIAKDVPASFYYLAQAFFPGPLTMIVPRNDMVPKNTNPNAATIAIRMPNHEVALALIKAVGEPLVAPSANLSGKPSPTSASDVLEDMNGKISAILDGGPCQVGIESTVLDLTQTTPTILRPGAITKAAIEKVLKNTVMEPKSSEGQPLLAPGMKYKHYSPDTHIMLSSSWEEIKNFVTSNPGKKNLLLTNQSPPSDILFQKQEPLSTVTLYALFRTADRMGFDEILIFLDEKTQADSGIMNRIEKAAR